MVWYKTELPIILTAACAVLMVSEYFIVVPSYVINFSTEVRNSSTILASYFIGLSAITMYRNHARQVIRRKSGWYNSIILIVTLTAVIAVGVLTGSQSNQTNWIYKYVLTSLDGAGFSLLAFYIASGAYRSFRVRTLETTLFLIAGILITFLNTPLMVAIFPGIVPVASWILDVPNTGAIRGVTMGVAFGVLGIGLRIILGKERGHMGAEK